MAAHSARWCESPARGPWRLSSSPSSWRSCRSSTRSSPSPSPYEREFGDLDNIAIVVEAPSLPEATLYANRLVRQLRTENVPLKRIAYRIDPKQFEGRGLLYLSKDRLANIRDAIFDYQEFMEAFAAHPTLDQTWWS